MKELLITGGTGTVGKEVIRRVLQTTNIVVHVLVHTRAKEMNSQEFAKNILLLDTDVSNRLHILEGDICESNLGLSDESSQKLKQHITYVMHCAASTRFDLPLEEARKINVHGTQQVLDFAAECNELQRVAFLSTVYVSGTQTGVVSETLVNPPGFVNTYEQSKNEAEHIVAQYWDDLPITIYRLSTIIGSTSGEVEHFTAPHHALRVMYLGLASMLPGKPEYSVDVLPTDVVGQVITMLFLKHFTSQQIVNICGGAENNYSLREMIDKSFLYLAQANPKWKKRDYAKPAIVSEEAFDLFLKTIEEAGNPLILNVLRAVRHFAHQLNYPKRFERTNLLAAIPDFDRRVPHVDTYFKRVVAYCVATNWGRC